MDAITLGATLCYVENQRRGGADPVDVIVTKVGRKWLTVKHADSPDGWWERRIHKETLVADGRGYMSPGACWRSRDEYETSVRRSQAWSALHSWLRNKYGCPDDISEDDIRKAAALLGCNIDDEMSRFAS